MNVSANQLVVHLTVPELVSIIDSRLEKLAEKLPDQEAEQLPEYLTRKQVAAYMRISLATVDNYARDGVLKRRYVGGRNRRTPRYHRDDVRQAMQQVGKEKGPINGPGQHNT